MRTSQTRNILPSVFPPDRGDAKYFHGRERILSNFAGLIQYSVQNKWGTTFLIQGALGAGKTALLAECVRIAKDQKWEIAPIRPPDLWTPDQLQRALYPEQGSRVTSGAGSVNAAGIAKAEVTTERIPDTTFSILRKGHLPLLLLMDEAQMLAPMMDSLLN